MLRYYTVYSGSSRHGAITKFIFKSAARSFYNEQVIKNTAPLIRLFENHLISKRQLTFNGYVDMKQILLLEHISLTNTKWAGCPCLIAKI